MLQEVSLGLLEQPWFWSVALATDAEELELVLVEESLRQVSSVAQEVLPGVEVRLVRRRGKSNYLIKFIS